MSTCQKGAEIFINEHQNCSKRWVSGQLPLVQTDKYHWHTIKIIIIIITVFAIVIIIITDWREVAVYFNLVQPPYYIATALVNTVFI